MAGPVIIADDGGPPFTFQIQRDYEQPPIFMGGLGTIRVGRKEENMDELKNQTEHEVKAAAKIMKVELWQKNVLIRACPLAHIE